MKPKTPIAKKLTMITGAIIGIAAVIGISWTAIKPHIESELDERYVTVETQSVLIDKQAEAQKKTTGILYNEIKTRSLKDEKRDLKLQIEFNEYRQESLEAIPETEKTPREKVRLRGLIREQQLLLEKQTELEER